MNTTAVAAVGLPVPSLPLLPGLLKLPEKPRKTSLLILGRDDRGRPHASRFPEGDGDAVRDAAALMGMTVVIADSPDLRALAGKLPEGRIFSSGKAFVPFVSKEMYDRLTMLAPAGSVPAAMAAAANGPASTAAAAATLSKPSASSAARQPLPEEWSRIRKGSVVLAQEKPDDGWWESAITEDKGDDLFVLQWRDWPDLPSFLRKRDQLALLPPHLTQA